MAQNLPSANIRPAGLPAAAGRTTGGFSARSLIRTDVIFALAIILIIMFMLVPMPTFMLDAGIAVSITFSVLILMNGTPPIPITQSVVVPAIQQHRLQPGVRLPARVDPHHLEAFALDWTAAV